jgi:hypothetical protein
MGIGKSTTQLKWLRYVFIQTTCFGPGNGPSSGLHKCDYGAVQVCYKLGIIGRPRTRSRCGT